MKVNIFAAKCITNLHVGNGDVNYNIIDQEVERDPVTGLPMINASGVKGAIREFFEAKWGKNNADVCKIFGSGKDDTAQGSYKFLQADMLFRPLRVADDKSSKSFVLATTDEILELFSKKVTGLTGTALVNNAKTATNNTLRIEGDKDVPLFTANEKWKDFIDQEFAIVENFEEYDLPVIARNVLDDNGISKNLWYEEFVPHESVFGLIILTPEEMDGKFKEAITSEPVQFGGNASIGYGLMSIKEVRI